jgi:hypothetical protein
MHTIYLVLALIAIYGGTLGALAFVMRRLKAKKVVEQLLSSQLAALQAKYKDVIDLESFQADIQRDIANLQSQQQETRYGNDQLQTQANHLKQQIDVFTSEQTVIDCGLYTPTYDFDISQKYKDELDRIRDRQKDRLKDETAAICTQNWTVNGSASEGKKQTKAYTRLMLRAFNGEADGFIANVRWNNVQRMTERLEGVYQAINKLGEVHTIHIQRDYFQLKLQELKITYEYQEKLKAEKDEQKRVQEQIREEERAQREFDRQIKESEDEERRSQLALEHAKQQLQEAQGAEVAKMNAKIAELQQKLAEATANKERAKSMAQMTKCGYVYVISNIGSFGDNRFKIGMTRRLVPTDRVDELNNASVPFEFDIHATIYSDNAPQLEYKLHERFGDRRVNLVNRHKEFFECTIGEIETVVREFNATIDVLKIPEAKAYRQTLVMRSATNGNGAAHINGHTAATQAKVVQATPVATVTDPVAAEQAYVFANNEKYGPFTSDQIRGYVAGGNFDAASSFYWKEGMTDWVPLAQLI